MKNLCNFCKKELEKENAKFCSLTCHANKRRENVINNWLAGLSPATKGKVMNMKVSIREYLLQQANYQCSKCSWDKINPSTGKSTLEINHIDGNPANSSPSNLEVICPNCHSLTSNFRNLNKGKSPRDR